MVRRLFGPVVETSSRDGRVPNHLQRACALSGSGTGRPSDFVRYGQVLSRILQASDLQKRIIGDRVPPTVAPP
jgi:hypothetical protein